MKFTSDLCGVAYKLVRVSGTRQNRHHQALHSQRGTLSAASHWRHGQIMVIRSISLLNTPRQVSNRVSSSLPSSSRQRVPLIACNSSRNSSSSNNINSSSSGGGAADSAADFVANSSDALSSMAPVLGYWPKDLVIYSVENLHTFVGLEYWMSIVGVTLVLRIFMLPLAAKTQKNTAAMACVRPEAEKIQKAYKDLPNYDTDNELKMQMAEEMKALWKKHDVNPFRALALPVVQLPIFISFFLAMRDMPTMYPSMSSGGAFWFTDLTAADPTMILPILNGVTFLAMVEMGSDGMAANQANTMKMVMRVLAVVMIPATMHFNSGLFVYWGANNMFSIIQTGAMKVPAVRTALSIPKMPAPEVTPDLKLADSVNPFKAFVDSVKEKRQKENDTRIEIIDGVKKPPPPPPPPPMMSSLKPVTFSNPRCIPKKKK